MKEKYINNQYHSLCLEFVEVKITLHFRPLYLLTHSLSFVLTDVDQA